MDNSAALHQQLMAEECMLLSVLRDQQVNDEGEMIRFASPSGKYAYAGKLSDCPV